jgi:hypothetical protein
VNKVPHRFPVSLDFRGKWPFGKGIPGAVYLIQEFVQGFF